MSFSADELSWLFSSDASPAIAQANGLEFTTKTMVEDVARLREHYGDRARALAELIVSRRVTSKKMAPALAATWWTDKDAAQQATPQTVAEYRASYLVARGTTVAHDLTCSVGTELTAMMEAGLQVTGSDFDPQRVAMARKNCPQVEIHVADALDPKQVGDLDPDAVLIADPARRNTAGRIHKLADMVPSLPDLVAAYPHHRLVVKSAPGLDFAQVEDYAEQVDIISVDGDVKEACVYVPVGSARRTDKKVLRRAVVLRQSQADGDTSTDGFNAANVDVLTSAEPDDVIDRPETGRYIVEPDGAVIRAGLVRHYAAREGMWLVDPHLAYVTGDRIPAGRRGFEILETVDVKRLKPALAARGVGRAEILVRGADIDPDQLRKKLKLKGKTAAIVVIARLGERGGKNKVVAYICRAIEPRM